MPEFLSTKQGKAVSKAVNKKYGLYKGDEERKTEQVQQYAEYAQAYWLTEDAQNINEEEVYNIEDCHDAVEYENDKIKLDMQTLLKGEKLMHDDDTLPSVNINNDVNEGQHDQENKPNIFATKRKSKAEQANEYIQKMKSKNSFLSNGDSAN